MAGRVLVIAESDPSEASGIQADIRTILAMDGYAMTALSAIPYVSALGIPLGMEPDTASVAEQMRNALSGDGIDCIKVGFLPHAAMVNAVADVLDEYQHKNIPIVVDPSIICRRGNALVDDAAIAAWKRRLYTNAKILIANLKEAELLGGMKITSIDDIRHEANMMRTLGVENVVLKGGQMEKGKELYFVATPTEERIYEHPAIDALNTPGASMIFSSALAVGLARKMDVLHAIEHCLPVARAATG